MVRNVLLVVLTLCGISACTAENQSYPNTINSGTSVNTMDDISYRSSPIFFNQQEVRPVENTSTSFSNPKTIMKGNLNEQIVETSNGGVIDISPHSGSEITDTPNEYWVHILVFSLIGVLTYLVVKCNKAHC